MIETTEGESALQTAEAVAPSEPIPKAPTPAERRAACFAEIEAVLRKHGCVIRAYHGPAEPVGRIGDTIQMQACFDIFPLVARP